MNNHDISEAWKAHFPKWQYQNAHGNWSTIYYAIFTDWKGYFREELSPKRLRPGSADRERRAFALLDRILGDVPLVEIKKAKILDYRKKEHLKAWAILRSIANCHSFGSS